MHKESRSGAYEFVDRGNFSLLERKDLFTYTKREKFLLPISILERLRLLFYVFFLKNFKRENTFLFEKYQIPLYWKILLGYLQKKDFISKAKFFTDEQFFDSPKLYSYKLQAFFPTSKTDGLPDGLEGYYARGTSGRTVEEAKSKAVGELLERYPLLCYKKDRLLKAATEHLKKSKRKFLDVTLLPEYSLLQEQNYPKLGRTSETIFLWTEGVSLVSKRKILLPAQLIFWNYQTVEGEGRLQQSTTNGAAGMFSYESAVLSGFFELLHRDSFLNYWLTFTTPKRIKIDSITLPATKSLLEKCERYKLEVFILDTSLDTTPFLCAAVILDRSGIGPAVVCGGGGGVDVEEVVLKSLIEALTARSWSQVTAKEGTFTEFEPSYGAFSESFSQKHRALLWSNSKMIANVDWFLKGEEVDLKKNLWVGKKDKNILKMLVKELEEKGVSYEPFLYRVKHKVLKALGFVTVKVIVPALTPLYFVEYYAPLASKRIKMLQENKFLNKGPFNSTPHPFL